jgi:hypothetical protein
MPELRTRRHVGHPPLAVARNFGQLDVVPEAFAARDLAVGAKRDGVQDGAMHDRRRASVRVDIAIMINRGSASAAIP